MTRQSTAGEVTQADVAKAQGELAQARVDLLRAKKEAAAKSDPELNALADELAQATIAAAEQRAILEEVESRYHQLEEEVAKQMRHEQHPEAAKHRAALLREQLAAVEKRLAELELEQLESAAARGARVEIIPWSE